MSKFSEGDKVTWTLGSVPDYQNLKATVVHVVEDQDEGESYYVISTRHGGMVAFDDEMEPEVENDCE